MKKKDKLVQQHSRGKTYYVSGMHCTSCEVLIEKKLLKQRGITFVDASLLGGRVEMHSKESLPNIDRLNDLFSDDGYQFSLSPGLSESRFEKKDYLIALGVLGIILFLFSFSDSSFLAKLTALDTSSSIIAFFILGVVASVSSCAALIGGLLLSLTKQWGDKTAGESQFIKIKPHAGFHVGRVLAFFIGGGILGLLGGFIAFDNVVLFSVLVLIISLVMLVLGLQMLNVPVVRSWRIALPKFLSSRVAVEDQSSSFAIGAGTFFLPCGFTLIAQGIALTSGSFVLGALVLGAFALGTFPVLGAISWSGLHISKKPHLTKRFQLVAGVLIIFFSFYNINGQLNVLGIPSFSDIEFSSKSNIDEPMMSYADPSLDPRNNLVAGKNSQTLRLVAQEFDYIPQGSTTLQSGVPTTMIVENKGVYGCGAYMAGRGLWKGPLNLRPGVNEISFTPKKGTYKITCTMGMVAPVTITVL